MKKLVSVCVFLLALMTGAFAMAQEPVYGVLFIPKKEYTLEKGKFRGNCTSGAGSQFYRRADAGERVQRGGEGGQ